MVVPPGVTSVRNNEEPRAGAGLATGQDPAEKLSPSQDPAVRDFGEPDVRDALWPTTGGLGQVRQYATGDPPTKSSPRSARPRAKKSIRAHQTVNPLAKIDPSAGRATSSGNEAIAAITHPTPIRSSALVRPSASRGERRRPGSAAGRDPRPAAGRTRALPEQLSPLGEEGRRAWAWSGCLRALEPPAGGP